MPRYKKFTFTLNNYTDQHIFDLAQFADIYLQYIKYGKEVASTGTPHLQGWFITKKEQSKKVIIESFPGKAHIEIMRGSELENEVYVSKENEVTELGTQQIITPNLEQVVKVILPQMDKWFNSTTTSHLFKQVKMYKKYLLSVVRTQCPVQYIRHRSGIIQYIDDHFAHNNSTDVIYVERVYYLDFSFHNDSH